MDGTFNHSYHFHSSDVKLKELYEVICDREEYDETHKDPIFERILKKNPFYSSAYLWI